MAEQTRERTARHESLHVVMGFVLDDRRFPVRASIIPEPNTLGHVKWLPSADVDYRDDSLAKIGDRVLALLAPYYADGARGCDTDLDHAWKLGKIAYVLQPDRRQDRDGWIAGWLDGPLRTRAEELLDSRRFRKLATALERALLEREHIDGPEVLVILKLADAHDPEPPPVQPEPQRSDAELRRALEKLSAP